MVSTFRGTLEFFAELGIYDVILPFLLVFTIVYAILEKTRVFGVDEINGKKFPKKNLNAMAAFVMAFFVVASAQLVDLITEVSANMVVLLLVGIFFTILVGALYKERDEGFELEDGWKITLSIISFIGIILIFLNAIKNSEGKSWWQVFIDWMSANWNAEVLGSILLVLIAVGLIIFVTHTPTEKKAKTKD
jgi:hypothetical protein